MLFPPLNHREVGPCGQGHTVRDGAGTGTALPSPHSLLRQHLPPQKQELGSSGVMAGAALPLLGKHCHLLASSTLSELSSPGFSSAARLPLGPLTAHAYCRPLLVFCSAVQVSPGLHGLSQPAPVTSQASPPNPQPLPHFAPLCSALLAPRPSWSTPGLPLPQAFSPAVPSAWDALAPGSWIASPSSPSGLCSDSKVSPE